MRAIGRTGAAVSQAAHLRSVGLSSPIVLLPPAARLFPVVLLLSAAVMVSSVGCSREEPSPQEGPREPLPVQVIDGIHLRQTSARGLLWVLDADEGVSEGSDKPTLLTNMTVRFYDGGTEVRSVLTSRRGRVDDRTQLLVAEDSVVVVTPAGEKLTTDSLRWDPKREIITTGAAFRFLRGEDVLTGRGFEADPDLSHYTIHHEVWGEIRDQDENKMMETLDGEKPDAR